MIPLVTDFPTLNLTDKTKEETVKTLVLPLIIDSAKRDKIRDVFMEEMRLGLSANPERKSSLLMENTFIPELTDGTEEGSYLALDLGGTNFRVMLMDIVKGVVENEDVVYYDIPKHLFHDDGPKLFDFMALSIEDFLTKRSIAHKKYDLGFTFSFPMIQKAVNIGILTSWAKSFDCPNVIGNNVVHMLEEALERNTKIHVNITAVLNDTTGTVVQGSYFDKRCAIGMILGTGNNACYLEKVSNINKWEGQHRENEVIIDIEWGAFGDNGVLDFMRTDWDRAVDDQSLLKKSFTFEKYIGGKFLGCIAREVLLTLAKEGVFCKGNFKLLQTNAALKTSVVTEIEEEIFRGELTYTKEVLSNKLGLEGVTDDDARIAQYVCGLVSYRAALLVSFLSSILMKRMDRPHCTIAVDGSLFENHPRFKPLMKHLIKSYAPGKEFSLLLAKDGSGKGAGLVAAIEERLRNTFYKNQ